MKGKNYKLSFFLYFLIFGVLVEIITVGAIYVHNHYDMLEQFKLKYSLESSIKRDLINDTIKQTELSIDSIMQNPIFLNYIDKNSVKNKKDAQYLFSSVSSDHENYMQVRYIDKSGLEKIRVDRDSKRQLPTIIEDKDLQNKGKRYYFKDTIATKKGAFWHSNLDLNMEKGKIEVPYKPTLRVAKQFFYQNQSRGIIIINISMKNLLKNLTKSSDFDIDMVDSSGNYIYGFDDENSWSMDLKNGKNILKDKHVNSLSSREISKDNSFLTPIDDIIKSKQKPFLIFSQKGDIVKKIKHQRVYVFMWIILFVSVVSMPLAYFISSIPLTLQRKLRNTLGKLQRFSNIVDKYVMTLIIDENYNIKSASSSFRKKVGYKSKDLFGKHISIVLSVKSDKEGAHIDNFEECMVMSKELNIIAKHGNIFWAEHTITSTLDKDGDVDERTIILVDVTEKKEFEKKTIMDPLTQLYNREGINKFLSREIGLAKRHASYFSIIMADIDFFKKVNDTFGHQAGDSVLIELSNLLQQATRTTDLVGRFGGEEFIIILPHTDRMGSTVLAESLRKKVEDYDFSVNSDITASFGVAILLENDTIKSLIERCDQALYEAKNSGRNKACFR